ncbi:ATP-binding protein [Haliscomenobacter sp.]|uniref:ATP-binding protein n=1 Tax=Haliscomenobacter sp. TaxID=2717303 RepID=UPI0033652E98
MPNSKIVRLLSNITAYIEAIVRTRTASVFNKDEGEILVHDFKISDEKTPLDEFIQDNNLGQTEITLLFIAIMPHIHPLLFDQIIQAALPSAGDFPQLGGTRGKNFRGFLPTGETALFLLAGDDMEKRMDVNELFSEDHLFAKKHILCLEEVPEGEPRMSGRIILSQEYVDLFTTGKVARPRFSMNFPAQLLQTELEWDDLVLHHDTLAQINELEIWVKHGDTLMKEWEMHRKIKPGYRALFYGPPGTGKTLTASLLGKYTGKEVYRIDLSMVVSKFIGETEKNLSNLFAKAENKDWILFFDEADALFGKRTNVRDAHDKYANQEVSYLLQRVEHYNGLVILATNFKSNIDDAFTRRFQSIIYFPMPGVEERTRLWKKAFPPRIKLAQDIQLPTLAQKYELSGAEIINIVQFACLRMLDRGDAHLQAKDLYEGIKKEFQKEGRIMR